MSSEANSELYLAKLGQAGSRREAFEHALAALLAELNPERALLAYKQKGTDELSAQACHNFDPQTVFVAGEISTELIKNVLREGKAMCLVDAIQHPGLANRTSVILSGLRSIVCVPIVHPSRLIVGLIYADNRIKTGAFGPDHQSWLEQLSAQLVTRLVEIERSAHQVTRDHERNPGPAEPAPDEQAYAEARAEGFQHFREGRSPEAIQCLEKAAKLAQAFGPQDRRWGKSLGELAELQRQAQAVEEAERNFIQAIDLLEQLGSAAHQDLAPVLMNLATLYFARGNGVRAEGLYRRALQIWQAHIASDDKRLAPLYYNLATLRRSAGAKDEARQLFQKALDIATKAWGPEHAHSQRCQAALNELQ